MQIREAERKKALGTWQLPPCTCHYAKSTTVCVDVQAGVRIRAMPKYPGRLSVSKAAVTHSFLRPTAYAGTAVPPEFRAYSTDWARGLRQPQYMDQGSALPSLLAKRDRGRTLPNNIILILNASRVPTSHCRPRNPRKIGSSEHRARGFVCFRSGSVLAGFTCVSGKHIRR